MSVVQDRTAIAAYMGSVPAQGRMTPYRFAPRIRDLPDKRLYAFKEAPATPTLAPMITRHVREQAIRTHWPEIQRLAATILSGGITAAHAITALSATTW